MRHVLVLLLLNACEQPNILMQPIAEISAFEEPNESSRAVKVMPLGKPFYTRARQFWQSKEWLEVDGTSLYVQTKLMTSYPALQTIEPVFIISGADAGKKVDVGTRDANSVYVIENGAFVRTLLNTDIRKNALTKDEYIERAIAAYPDSAKAADFVEKAIALAPDDPFLSSWRDPARRSVDPAALAAIGSFIPECAVPKKPGKAYVRALAINDELLLNDTVTVLAIQGPSAVIEVSVPDVEIYESCDRPSS